MIDNNKMIKVVNRNNGSTGYTIPDLGNLHRNFAPYEEKEITFDQLRKLSYQPGGMYILENLLAIEDAEATKELLGHVEQEYSYTNEDVKRIMTTGSLDAFLDMLDFAPTGILEIVKSMAVTLPLNDVAKRNAIKEKLGFDVDKAIELKTSVEDKPETEAHVRRVTTKSEPKVTGRRVVTNGQK